GVSVRSLRLFVVAALVSVATVAVPVTSQAAVVRRLDLAVLNPMPVERLIASGVIGLNLRPVVVQADVGAARAWVVIARGTSTATGTFRIVYLSPRRLGALKLRVVGMPARGLPVATPVRAVSVTRPSVALTTVATGTVGTTQRMTVAARPPRAGRAVYVQRRRLGATVWANAAAGRREVGATGVTAFAIPLGTATGVHEFRATFATPTGPIGSVVRRVSITAVPPPPTGPLRPTVSLQPAPGPTSPALDGLGGSETDFSATGDRWDPCRGVSYRVNVSAVPAASRGTATSQITAALATLSSDSGLQFASLGDTTFAHPATQTFETPAGRPADAALTIAFVTGGGDALYEAGHAYVRAQSSTMTGPGEIVTADIVLFLGNLLDPNAPDILDAAATRETILHELGHSAGLSHASEQSVMAAVKYGAPFSEYQRGDRAGLLAVGSPRGCIAR
ncbi:MAG: hypothetical protein ABIM89_06975, partial [Mycobacteriales bacterium]